MDETTLRKDYGWAIAIVRKHFVSGLNHISEERFLQRRYQEFKSNDDPVYADLLGGMNDERLAKTFVSYWILGQTMATQSRFWLENAVAELIIHQAQKLGRAVDHVYTQSMLADGWLSRMVDVASIGEEQLEHLSDRSPWRALIQRSALEGIDVTVGQRERERVAKRELYRSRDWQRENEPELKARDRTDLTRVVESLTGPPAEETTLQCNLLVIGPNEKGTAQTVRAIRFVNPKTMSSHAYRKQERVNLMRVYALLVQEKIMREPSAISVCVAELVPRLTSFDEQDRYPDYFSVETFWSSEELWEYIDVPFAAVRIAIREAGAELRERLAPGLRGLLPDAPEPQPPKRRRR